MKKISAPQDHFYIAPIHGKCKGGKTGNIYNRFGNSQYNTGVFDNRPSYVYFAVPSVVFPIDRLEALYEREFAEYLIPSKKNFRKLTEFIDPKYTKITVEVIRDFIESVIKSENLPIKRLKQEYLLTCTIDNEFSQKVRDSIVDGESKYLEEI